MALQTSTDSIREKLQQDVNKIRVSGIQSYCFTSLLPEAESNSVFHQQKLSPGPCVLVCSERGMVAADGDKLPREDGRTEGQAKLRTLDVASGGWGTREDGPTIREGDDTPLVSSSTSTPSASKKRVRPH